MDLLHTQYIATTLFTVRDAVTVHDILFESHPEYFDKLFLLRSRLLVRHSVRKSAKVFTVSDSRGGRFPKLFASASTRTHNPQWVDGERFFPARKGERSQRMQGWSQDAIF